MRIGIIGQGFVGTAVREGLKKYHTIRTYDLDETKRNCDSIEELVDKSTVLFVCLPTPMNKDGSCNIEIVESVVKEINFCAENNKIAYYTNDVMKNVSYIYVLCLHG